jgi:hypothetical protein
MIGSSQLEVIDVEVQTTEYDPDRWIERFLGGDLDIVRGLDISAKGRVRSTDEANTFRPEFRFYARFSDDEYSSPVRRKLENTGNVDCSRIGGAKDFFLDGTCSLEEGERQREGLSGYSRLRLECPCC